MRTQSAGLGSVSTTMEMGGSWSAGTGGISPYESGLGDGSISGQGSSCDGDDSVSGSRGGKICAERSSSDGDSMSVMYGGDWSGTSSSVSGISNYAHGGGAVSRSLSHSGSSADNGSYRGGVEPSVGRRDLQEGCMCADSAVDNG